MVELPHPRSTWKDVSIANRQRTPVQALSYSLINYSDLDAVHMLMENVGDIKLEYRKCGIYEQINIIQP